MNDNHAGSVQSKNDHKGGNVCKGQYGEELAALFLREHGYQIVFRNFYSRYGELDIVAKKNHLLSFVEVKTRTGENYGMPAEAITAKKRRHMTYAANFFIQRFGLHQMDFRFDVIEVSLNHLENV
jgi:putative endonuclease